jgi:hypothetical protein
VWRLCCDAVDRVAVQVDVGADDCIMHLSILHRELGGKINGRSHRRKKGHGSGLLLFPCVDDR